MLVRRTVVPLTTPLWLPLFHRFVTTFSLPSSVNPAEGLGSPATKRILVHFEVKVKHFMALMSCIVSAASYRTV